MLYLYFYHATYFRLDETIILLNKVLASLKGEETLSTRQHGNLQTWLALKPTNATSFIHAPTALKMQYIEEFKNDVA